MKRRRSRHTSTIRESGVTGRGVMEPTLKSMWRRSSLPKQFLRECFESSKMISHTIKRASIDIIYDK